MSGARPWLRSLRSPLRHLLAGGHQDPALPRGHLLVRVEGEGRDVPGGADPPALGVHGAERLAGVLQDPEPAIVGDLSSAGRSAG